jgi:hypothetical protein
MQDSRFEIIIDYPYNDVDLDRGLTYSVTAFTTYLDTYKEESISLNYNIADLYDIGARNSSYSKTIKIPETKRNRLIFGNISDLAASTNFNPNLKTRCFIMSEGYLVFEGYLQLRNVIFNNYEDRAEYEIVIFADNDNFFKAMGEKYLTDLDFSELNHLYIGSNIRRSWTASNTELAYYYPLIDYGFDFDYLKISATPIPGSPTPDGIDQGQFYPATNVKYIVDKIFRDAGYTYQSNFLNSKVFRNLYIPYHGPELRNEPTNEGLFSAGRFTGVSFSTQYLAQPVFPGNPTNANYVFPYPELLPPAGIGYFARNYDWGVYRIPFNTESAPFGDPQGVYDPVNYVYTAPAAPALVRAMKFVVNFDIQLQFGIDPALFTTNSTPPHGPANTPANWIAIRRSRNVFGNPSTSAFVSVGGVNGRIPFNSPSITNLSLEDPVTLQVYELNNNPNPNLVNVTRYKRIRGSIVSDTLNVANAYASNYRLFNGEQVWVEIKLGTLNGEYRVQVNDQNGAGVGWGGNGVGYFVGANILTGANVFQGTQQLPNVPPGLPLGTFSSANTFYNSISSQLLPGDSVEYNEVIPRNIKNKDFIASIIKMFNLYVEPSRDMPNMLLIEPRDEYYAAGQIKDWTNKIDLSGDFTEQILAETQSREIRFKYKDDSDFYNEDYSKRENISFGEERIILDNEFTTGVKTIEPIFSPTPLVVMTNAEDQARPIIIPKIGKLQDNLFDGTEMNLRIGTRYEPNQTSPWTFGGLTTSQSTNFPGYAVITSQGIAPQRQQSFNAGDVIQISQNDNGATYPSLQGTFEVLEVINSRTIVISLVPAPTWVGYVAGLATPIPGVVGSIPWNFIEGTNVRRFNYYPYLGHFSHPRRPNYDLNYGQGRGYYHDLETITNKTLYYEYWKGFFDEITDKDSRVITCSLLLDPQDIADFRFNDNIYINGQYYKVNKIINYDPTARRTTRVELIKSRSYKIERTELQFGGVAGRFEGTYPTRQPSILGFRGRSNSSLMTNNTNQIRRADTIVAGRSNMVAAATSLVVGDINRVLSDESIVFGSGNVINSQSEGNIVMGSGNTISSNVQNSFIVGDGMNVDSSNTLAFGGSIASVANYVNASRNEVLSPFNMKPSNYISGSVNAIQEFGSQDAVNYINGGFYSADV